MLRAGASSPSPTETIMRNLILLAAASLLSVGCELEEPVTYDEGSFIDAYIETMCDLELRCYEDTSPFEDEHACYDAAVDYGYPSFGDGCGFDQEAASECIDGFSRSGCIDFFNDERPSSCATVFTGECEWSEL